MSIRETDAREHPDRYLPLDRRSAALFVDDWEPLVRGVLQRMRVRELDDGLSEVFRRALNGLAEFRGESRLSSRLYRIAWREGLRQAGREKARDAREVPLEIAAGTPDRAEDQLRTFERRETAARVRAALAGLRPHDREIVALRYLEELPHAQVAERLDISESAAKVRCHRALTRLRILLEKDLEDDDE